MFPVLQVEEFAEKSREPGPRSHMDVSCPRGKFYLYNDDNNTGVIKNFRTHKPLLELAAWHFIFHIFHLENHYYHNLEFFVISP